MNELTTMLTVIALVGTGIIGGLLFTFSNFMMRVLSKLPGNQGMITMQSINTSIQNPIFFLVFFGSAVITLLLSILAIIDFSTIGQLYLLGGSVSYFLGCFVVTAFVNVPLNNLLAAANHENEEGKQLWQRYLSRWTFWNHVRVVSCLLAISLLAISLIF